MVNHTLQGGGELTQGEVKRLHTLRKRALSSNPPVYATQGSCCCGFAIPETGKIRLVQKVLGHSDLSTTMVYTHIHDPEVEEALKSFRQATAVAVRV